VLLYWSGFSQFDYLPGDSDTIRVNGIDYLGNRIGGSSNVDSDFGGIRWATSYRRDITGFNVVKGGQNTLTIEDLGHFSLQMTGAALLVTFDDFSQPLAQPQIRDGEDYAFVPLSGVASVTNGQAVAQTFNFAASASPRIAQLSMLFGDGS